jgi:hypothetical protein
MSSEVQRTYSETELLSAAARYMDESFGSIPKVEPARTQWYQSYGLLISFAGYLWGCDVCRGAQQHGAEHGD